MRSDACSQVGPKAIRLATLVGRGAQMPAGGGGNGRARRWFGHICGIWRGRARVGLACACSLTRVGHSVAGAVDHSLSARSPGLPTRFSTNSPGLGPP